MIQTSKGTKRSVLCGSATSPGGHCRRSGHRSALAPCPDATAPRRRLTVCSGGTS